MLHTEERDGLAAPPGYWRLTPEEKEKICNGCGAKSALVDFVPDTIWGLDISEACNIHDYCWHVAEPTWQAFHDANRLFLDNMLRLINRLTRWSWMRWLRRKRALKYYQAVEEFGRHIFWSGRPR